jgi:hypothetical protein
MTIRLKSKTKGINFNIVKDKFYFNNQSSGVIKTSGLTIEKNIGESDHYILDENGNKAKSYYEMMGLKSR